MVANDGEGTGSRSESYAFSSLPRASVLDGQAVDVHTSTAHGAYNERAGAGDRPQRQPADLTAVVGQVVS